MEKIILHKEGIVTLIVTVLCLSVFALFPTNGTLENFIAEVIFLLITPLLYLTFILKNNIRDYGFQVGDWKKGLFWSILGVVTVFLFINILQKEFTIYSQYQLRMQYMENFWNFIFYEFFIIGSIISVIYFFFHGFFLFSFSPYLKKVTILFQLLILVSLLSLSKSINLNILPYILFFPFAGMAAYKSRSILYSVVGQLILIIIIEASVLGSIIISR